MKSHADLQSSVMQELAWRGFLYQCTHDELDEWLAKEKITLYCGFDPSAASLHVGNVMGLMMLTHFHRHGHRPLALVGGATGLIGDPSGKDQERELQTEEVIASNLEGIRGQIQRVLLRANEGRAGSGSTETGPEVVNNADWFKQWSYIDFLRDIGKFFRVNAMLQKDSVRARLEEREQGISYTEFSYMLIQSYDFLHLFREKGCKLQVGGSDQWGNITTGTELIRRVESETAFGLSFPLITAADGKKLGKSEKGAIYLDPELTSPYEFYQYWVSQDDRDCGKLLRLFTFLSQEEIEALEAKIENGENRGEVQQKLAEEVTNLIHGVDETAKVQRASRMLFGEKIEGLSDRDLQSIFADVPSTEIKRSRLGSEDFGIIDAMVESGLQGSKGAARRLIQQGGAYINNEAVESHEYLISEEDLASETMLVLRSGKKKYHVLRFL